MRSFLAGLLAGSVFLVACSAIKSCMSPPPPARKATCTIGQAPERMVF